MSDRLIVVMTGVLSPSFPAPFQFSGLFILMRYVFFLTTFGFAAVLSAQPDICATSATPSIVRIEGLAERVGDIVYSCTGAPNSTVTVNFSISLNTNISNRISSGNTLTGLIFTIDNG